MAKKSIILSNEDGRVTFTNTGSVSVDDVTNNISASYITASQVSFPSLSPTTVRILSSSTTSLSTFGTGTATLNGALAFNGTTWVASAIQPFDYSGSAGGDIAGDYYGNVVIKNISNVSTGTLGVNYGGTGISIESHPRNILKSSGSVISTLSGYASGSILTSTSGSWEVSLPAWKPNVQIFTTPGIYNWKKPAGATFAKIVVQGGGGSGANASRFAATTVYGVGGAAGGYADGVFDISNILDAQIKVGSGGASPTGSITTTQIDGNSGEQSYFLADQISVYGNGGGAGYTNDTTPTVVVNGGAAGGANVIKSGGNSNSSNTISTAVDVPSGGGWGTGANRTASTPAKTINIPGFFGFDYNLKSDKIPELAAKGGDATDLNRVDSQFLEDPYVLLHMKPFSEIKIDVQTSQSAYSPVVSWNGSAEFTNEKSMFGGYSLKPMYYSQNGCYNTGSVTITPGYNLATGDFTAEAWVYLNSTGSNSVGSGGRMILYETRNATNSVNRYLVSFVTGGKLGFYTGIGPSFLLTSSLAVPTGSWQHIALVRSSNTFRFYINGTQDTNTLSNTNSFDATNILIGNSSFSSEAQLSFDGYIDNFQIVKGAKYTGNYSVPTAPFIKDVNTVVLLNSAPYENYLTTSTADSSYYGKQITFNNSASLTSSTTAFGDTNYVFYPRSATNSTGSMTITSVENLSTGSFTVEMWINPINFNNTTTVLFDSRQGTAPSTTGFSIGLLSGSNRLFFSTGSTSTTTVSSIVTSSNSITAGAWQHIALVRSGSTSRFYVNGVQDSNTGSVTSDFSNTGYYTLGMSSIAGVEQGRAFNGYIDEFRITPKVLYTSSFTAPQQRFSDPYNPLLLLHMDPVNSNKNSTIDSSNFNSNIVFRSSAGTVHAAAISNAVGNPFNSYGYALQASGSTSVSTAINAIGTNTIMQLEPFTFECWVYLKDYTAAGRVLYVVGDDTVAAGYSIRIEAGTGRLQYFVGSVRGTSNRSIPPNVWTHIAFCKNGALGTSCFYFNGIKDTKTFSISSTYSIKNTQFQIGGGYSVNTLNFNGYIDEVRVSKNTVYTGSVYTVPTSQFADPNKINYTYDTNKNGIWGSGGGGGVAPTTILQDFNKVYLGGKGGDGYVAVISW